MIRFFNAGTGIKCLTPTNTNTTFQGPSAVIPMKMPVCLPVSKTDLYQDEEYYFEL
jgi:hypothetical protein